MEHFLNSEVQECLYEIGEQDVKFRDNPKTMEKLDKIFEKLDKYYEMIHNDDISKNNAATMLKYLLSKDEKFKLITSPYERIYFADWDEQTGNLKFGILYNQGKVTYERDESKETSGTDAYREKIISKENKYTFGAFTTVEDDEIQY